MNWRFLFFLPSLLLAAKSPHDFEKNQPQAWFTGPLLAPSSLIVPKGHFYFEPYIYITANTGTYNSKGEVVKSDTLWVNSFQPGMEVGLTSWMDIYITPALNYNYIDHHARWTPGDLDLTIDIQLYQSSLDEWWPNVKLSLREIFPVGKYDHLDPKKMGADIGGQGSYNTGFDLVVGKLIHFGGIYFSTVRLSFFYSLPAAVHLKGFNAYGGGYGTNARFFPAQNLQVDFGVEVNLSQNWALACDVVGTWAGKDHFSGDPGTASGGGPATLGTGSSVQYALAPAFEYNWNANVGIIAGSWFTFAGRNAPRFWSFVAAFSYYI